MGTPEQFAADCDRAAAELRRMPADLRRALSAEEESKVGEPLADRISGALSGPYARALSGSVEAVATAEGLEIVIGGSQRVASGGAQARDLVFGTEFGGGGRVTTVPARPGRRSYRLRSTRQFRQAHPFVFKTLDRSAEWIVDRYLEIVDGVIDRG